jgi:uncharacterized membrane protein YbhN (UPF0104 family)
MKADETLAAARIGRGTIALSIALAAALIGVIPWYCDFAAIASVIASVGLGVGLVLSAIYLVALFLRAFRFRIHMPGDNRPTVFELSPVVSIHQAFKHLPPARIGALAFPMVLRRRPAVFRTQAISSLLTSRLSDLLSVSVLFFNAVVIVFGGRHTELTARELPRGLGDHSHGGDPGLLPMDRLDHESADDSLRIEPTAVA